MTTREDGTTGAGYYSYDGLDRALHEKARLGILTALAARPEGLAFVELKRLCALTDGNLSRHLQVLQDAHLVDVRKEREGARSLTVIRMTRAGRAQFVAYLDELERVIRDARAVESPREASGWAPA
jgi:DNA-binding transcriptional ArsR family regulator